MTTPTDRPSRRSTDRPLELDDVSAGSRFRERHRRTIDLPIDDVWPAALAVTTSEIRLLGPLMELRTLPARVAARFGRSTRTDGHLDSTEPTDPTEPAEPSFLDAFTAEGFVMLRRDEEAPPGPEPRRAVVLFGAAGRFWQPLADVPVEFEDAAAFTAFSEPGYAVIAASLEAVARGDRTELITETRVGGTDRGAVRRFAPYWALIRLPSGLIRRSWLAAIERRARAARP